MLLGVTFPAAFAQDNPTPDFYSTNKPVAVDLFLSQMKLAPGEDLQVLVRLKIDSEWHVNSHTPLQDYLIPTSIELEDTTVFRTGLISYPTARKVTFEFSPDEPLSVYSGTADSRLIVSVPSDVRSGEYNLIILATTQACNDRMCIAPATERFAIPVKVDPSFAGSEMQHASLFESSSSSLEESPAKPETAGDAGFWEMLKNFDATAFVDKYGFILAYIAMYLLGLGLTLTPCVYPIIPITIGYFGTQTGGSWSRQLLSATVFGFGIAISYATVGTIAAFSGALMGAALQNTWVLVGLAALCVAMGFNSFGAFEIRLPGWMAGLTSGGSRKGLVGAALMGLTMGIASAPCLAAFIISLLAFIGQKGDPLLGFTMFLVLGLGLATPFIALGTFSGMMNKLPKSGGWMIYAKKLMGSLLFGAALYFLNTVLPERIFNSIVLVALVAAGLYFGYFEPTPAKTLFFKLFRGVIGILFIAVAIWWGTPPEQVAETGGISWQTYTPEAVRQASAMGQPVLIDVYADWCIPCKELDKLAFSDSRVIESAGRFAAFKADLTRGNSPENSELKKLYEIKGVPTVIFIGADGREVRDLRLNQFEPAEEVLRRLESIGAVD